MRPHIDHAFQTKFGTYRGGGHPMLTCASFRDDPVFPHSACQDNLAQDIVNFMRACVIELVTLEIDLRATQMLGQSLGKV